MKSNPVVQSLGHALLAFVYILLVAFVMHNGEQVFGHDDKIWGTIAVLTLFVLSASVMGALVLGRPILLYLDGHKTAAVKFFGYTLGWMVVILAIIFVSQAWR